MDDFIFQYNKINDRMYLFDHMERQVTTLSYIIVKYFSDLDQTQEKLLNANQRLDDKEKALLNAEGEVAALNRRIQNLEEELEKTEDRFVERLCRL